MICDGTKIKWKLIDSKTIKFKREDSYEEETYEFNQYGTEAFSIKPDYDDPIRLIIRPSTKKRKKSQISR